MTRTPNVGEWVRIPSGERLQVARAGADVWVKSPFGDLALIGPFRKENLR